MRNIKSIIMILLVSFVAVNSCKKKSSNTTQTTPYTITYFNNDSVQKQVITSLAELDNSDSKAQIRGRQNADGTYYISSMVFVKKSDGSRNYIVRSEGSGRIYYGSVTAQGKPGKELVEIRPFSTDSAYMKLITINEDGDWTVEHQLNIDYTSQTVVTAFKDGGDDNFLNESVKDFLLSCVTTINSKNPVVGKLLEKVIEKYTGHKKLIDDTKDNSKKIEDTDIPTIKHNTIKTYPDIDYVDDVKPKEKEIKRIKKKFILKQISPAAIDARTNEWLHSPLSVQVTDEQGKPAKGIQVYFSLNSGQFAYMRRPGELLSHENKTAGYSNSNGIVYADLKPVGDEGAKFIVSCMATIDENFVYDVESDIVSFEITIKKFDDLKILTLNRQPNSKDVTLNFAGGTPPFKVEVWNGWKTLGPTTTITNRSYDFSLVYDGIYSARVTDANGFVDSLQDSINDVTIKVSSISKYMVVNVKSPLGLLPMFLVPRASEKYKYILSRLINKSDNKDMLENENDYCFKNYGTAPNIQNVANNASDGSTDYYFFLTGASGKSFSMSVRFPNNLKHGWSCPSGISSNEYWTDPLSFNYTIP